MNNKIITYSFMILYLEVKAMADKKMTKIIFSGGGSSTAVEVPVGFVEQMYNEGQQLVKDLFPQVFDEKFMSEIEPNKKSLVQSK